MHTLTPELEALIEIKHGEYLATALATGPEDRAALEAAILGIYAREKLAPPTSFVYCRSPKEAAAALHAIGEESASTDFLGAYDMSYISRHIFARDHVYSEEELAADMTPGQALDDSLDLAALEVIAKNASVWWPAESCIILLRPESYHFAANGDLHSEDGAAIRWADGSGTWMMHGHRVTQQIVMAPETMTPEIIEAIPNDEARRIALARYGVERYAQERGAEVIDHDEQFGCPRALVRLNDGSHWYVGTDGSTGRPYWMSTFSDVSSVSEAHERICGFDESMIQDRS